MMPLRLLAAAALLWAGLVGPAHASGLPACRVDDDRELTAACRAALLQASVGDVLAHVKPWLADRRYARVAQVLHEAVRQHPGSTLLRQSLHEAQSLAEEAAWLASRQPESAAAGDDEFALAETRCLRLAGEAALAGCDQALQKRPGEPRLLVARGDALLTLGRTEEAEATYRVAAAQNPGLVLDKKIAIAKGTATAPPSPSQFSAPKPAPAPAADGQQPMNPTVFGRYHALVIGNDAYQHLERLDTAVNDARVIAGVLADDYKFDVTLLTDATRADIVETLDDFRNRLSARDNLLIYYAGHGWLDNEADKGYWLPIDARQDRRTQWVSNDTVRDTLRALRAKHVLVVADSCFSGTLMRGAELRAGRSPDYIERMAQRKARQVLTSGGLEPVADSSGGGHSPFAAALISALRANRGVLDATSLFSELRRPVAVNSEQLPQFADIRMAGHDGGDFLFVRRK